MHEVSGRRWEETPAGWSLRRLIEVLHQVCEAVGYAHSRGVVHRDLKPSNVMVGAHGEVLVLDWGLAKVMGCPELLVGPETAFQVQTTRSLDSAHQTQVGQVAGTPAYMPIEQATGQIDDIDARSDVYALGAILYRVLAGRAPYQGEGSREVLARVLAGPPEPLHVPSNVTAGPHGMHGPLRAACGRPLPRALVSACERAMEREQDQRFTSASELAAELQAWLDGSRRREEAMAVLACARPLGPEAAALKRQASALRREAADFLSDIESWCPEEDKALGWAKEDQAASLEQQAALLDLEQESLLRGSLTHSPELPEAHSALATWYRARHALAEDAGHSTAGAELLLRRHLAPLREDHPERLAHEAYLSGGGALTLVTDPPGAEVLLHRYVLHNRRLVLRPQGSLGQTPLRAVDLPMGSYLCILRHPQRAEVRYPVSIRRGEHWNGVPPDGRVPHPIVLPRVAELGPDDCYVPAGWACLGGGPPEEAGLRQERVWLAGHVFQRFPVTNQRFIEFLDTLMATGREQEALQFVPRERAGKEGGFSGMIYGLHDGRFSLRPDADGDVWEADAPVCQISWFAACAFARWEAARTGLAWRLPDEMAWEKTARGVDGRLYPWGDGFDPSWVCMRRSHKERMVPAKVDSFEVDQSVYGVRGLAGNMQDWCLDRFDVKGPPACDWGAEPVVVDPADTAAVRSCRGGGWFNSQMFSRLTHRYSGPAFIRRPNLSFRLVRSYPGSTPS